MTLIHAADRTYALPTEPTQCGRCMSMSGLFVNKCGSTFCVRCDVEERSQIPYITDGELRPGKIWPHYCSVHCRFSPCPLCAA